MSLSRALRRFLLLSRARRVAVEREYQALNSMLTRIREAEQDRPPRQRRVWADEVE